MDDIFAGLEELGFKNIDKKDLFKQEEEKPIKKEASAEKKEINIEQYEKESVFDKKQECPVCYQKFTSKAVRMGKTRLLRTDTDLRHVYKPFDPSKYDVVACPNCGYAVVGKSFDGLSAMQRKLVKEQVSEQFKGLPETGDTYTYEEALLRYKLALFSAIAKKSKNSERAYTCLKIAWLYRGKQESMQPEEADYEQKIAALKQEENNFIMKAYQGFQTAVQNEMFPICGMDEITFDYLLADLARQAGDIGVAKKLLGQVIISKTANKNVKEKALLLKEVILNMEKESNK